VQSSLKKRFIYTEGRVSMNIQYRNKHTCKVGGLMISALVPGASGPGSSSGRGVVFLGKTLSLSPLRSLNRYRRIAGET